MGATLGLPILVFAALASCGDDGTGPTSGLQIEPDSVELVLGDTVRLSAVLFESGTRTEPTEVGWTTLDAGIARVDSTGLVRGVGAGSTQIVAVVGDLAAAARVVVLDPFVSLSIVPDSAAVAVDDTVQYTAILRRASGLTTEATDAVWTSANASIATVDNTGRAAGRTPGSTEVRAVAEGLTDEARIVVAQWRRLASLPEPRRAGHAAGLGGNLYYIAGNASTGEDYVATTYVFDPASATWSTGASAPTARDQGATAVAAGRVYVIGGINPDAPTHNGLGRLFVNERYDPAADTWESPTPMPTARGGARADTLNGQIYVVGGNSGAFEILDTVEVYDPVSDTWSAGPSMPAGRITHAIGSIQGKLYVAGGEGEARDVRAELLIFDPASGAWSEGPALPTARHRVASAVLDGRLVVLGGLSNVSVGNFLTVVESFDPATNSWSTLPALPYPVMDAAAAVVDGRLYLIGGITPEGITDRALTPLP